MVQTSVHSSVRGNEGSASRASAAGEFVGVARCERRFSKVCNAGIVLLKLVMAPITAGARNWE